MTPDRRKKKIIIQSELQNFTDADSCMHITGWHIMGKSYTVHEDYAEVCV